MGGKSGGEAESAPRAQARPARARTGALAAELGRTHFVVLGQLLRLRRQCLCVLDVAVAVAPQLLQLGRLVVSWPGIGRQSLLEGQDHLAMHVRLFAVGGGLLSILDGPVQVVLRGDCDLHHSSALGRSGGRHLWASGNRSDGRDHCGSHENDGCQMPSCLGTLCGHREPPAIVLGCALAGWPTFRDERERTLIRGSRNAPDCLLTSIMGRVD